jgi:Uma2 family endonuclease
LVAQREPRYMTVEEWRRLERNSSDVKYEYFDGQVYLMSGGSLAHSRISNNAIRALEDALESQSCYVYNSEASVRLSETRYAYPKYWRTCPSRHTLQGDRCSSYAERTGRRLAPVDKTYIRQDDDRISRRTRTRK